MALCRLQSEGKYRDLLSDVQIGDCFGQKKSSMPVSPHRPIVYNNRKCLPQKRIVDAFGQNHVLTSFGFEINEISDYCNQKNKIIEKNTLYLHDKEISNYRIEIQTTNYDR